MKPQDFFIFCESNALSLVYIGDEFGGNDMKAIGDVATFTLKCVTYLIFKPGRLLARAWFLEITFILPKCVCVCVCVCPPPRP